MWVLGAVQSDARSKVVEKSIDNAIVLLVLALGSICEVRDRPIPGPIMEYIVDFRRQKIPQLPGPPASPVVLSPAYHKDDSLRNLDVIQELALYAYASGILGNLHGANGLPHVQAALLAGVYAG